MYTDAVRVVLEMGKASTSTLQRRLRLGYGRAARILDMMQREGIIRIGAAGWKRSSKPRLFIGRCLACKPDEASSGALASLAFAYALF
jgi:hypothetical protein